MRNLEWQIIALTIMSLALVSACTPATSVPENFARLAVKLEVVGTDTCMAQIGEQTYSLTENRPAFVAAAKMQADKQQGAETREAKVTSRSNVPYVCLSRAIFALQQAGFNKIGAIVLPE